jgi:hypothetical protein
MAALIGRGNTAMRSENSAVRRSASTGGWNVIWNVDVQRWKLGDKYIRFLTWLARQPLRCLKKEYRKPPVRDTIRQKVTAAETASLVAMLTLPQVILQVFGAAYYHRDLELQLNDAANIGRYVC